ncbi:hypothetical protein HGG70_07400 [Rhodobacteraceae bacterium R_SAG4]|nr:hypothetical protein [Rhodobacteraceae bacterium R_SAG4]
MAKIKFGALDGALANFGIAILSFDTETGALEVLDLILNKTEKSKHKQTRSSTDDLVRAQSQAEFMRKSLEGCAIVFGEVPSGGQDAKSTRAFGIVTGLYASITLPFQEVTPSEVKMAAVGTNTASKEEMIIWATELFPNAPWRRAQKNGAKIKKGDLTKDNEHLADAVAIGHAGIKTPVFQQMLSIFRATSLAQAA